MRPRSLRRRSNKPPPPPAFPAGERRADRLMTMKIQPMVDNEAADPSRKAGRQRLRADRGSPRGLHRHWWPFAIPAVALTWLFFLIPFVLNIRFAFTQWTGFSDVISWNGLKNFRGLIDQGILWKSIEVTLVYAGIAMV